MTKHSKPSTVEHIPVQDGATHINIWSRGRTSLGRDLSNFARRAFYHPKYGAFSSLEGFWHWLSTGMKLDFFRDMYGMHAKMASKDLPKVHHPNFQEEIIIALRCKIEQNPDLQEELRLSTLPFTHYFVYGDRVINQDQYAWQVAAIEGIRRELQQKSL